MKVLVEGHRYELAAYEQPEVNKQKLQFIHKEPTGDDKGTLETISDGTTNEEVLRVLINRLQYLNGKFPCRENSLAITKLEEALMSLLQRTADRKQRGVEGKQIK